MPGAEFYSGLLVYTSLKMLWFMMFVLSFVWGFAKFVLPWWWKAGAARVKERERMRTVKPPTGQSLHQAAS